jgi:hypothetical protein
MEQHFQYLVIYYVPDVLGSARINLGVILFAPNAKTPGVRFISDWRRIQSLHPEGDLNVIQAICRDIEQRVRAGDAEEVVRVMEDSFSNAVQVSARMNCESQDSDQAMNNLAAIYLTNGVEPERHSAGGKSQRPRRG